MIDWFLYLVSERTQVENIEIRRLHPQPAGNQMSQACALPAVPMFQPPGQSDRQTKLAGARLKTTANTRDFQSGEPYPTRGGEIYLDPSRMLQAASSQVAESEYSSFTNPIFSSTDQGPNLPR